MAAGTLEPSSYRLPAPIQEPLSRSWTEEEAFAYCSRLTLGHYENFPVGSLFIPEKLRPAIHSLYAFMRTADDFSDEDRRPGDEAEKMAYLETWDSLLTEALAGQAKHPTFIALAATLRQHDLPVQWLRDLLTAFKMDVTKRRYANFEEVLNYCHYSANPVGRLILTLFGYKDEILYQLSDHICTGLQLANHWQDVAIDWKKDRVYLPQDDMQRFGVSDAALARSECTPEFQKLMAFQVNRAKEIFQQGRALPSRVQGRLKLELRVTWLGGWRILEKIEQVRYDVFHHRPTVGTQDLPWFLWKILRGA